MQTYLSEKMNGCVIEINVTAFYQIYFGVLRVYLCYIE